MPEHVGLNEIPVDLFHFLLVFDLVTFLGRDWEAGIYPPSALKLRSRIEEARNEVRSGCQVRGQDWLLLS